MNNRKNNKSTSWEGVGKWYNKTVGTKGMHYHQSIVIPGVLRFLDLPLQDNCSLLDIACGQGVLSRNIDKKIPYTGIDISPKLVKLAKSQETSKKHQFFTGDASKKFPFKKDDFTHAAIVLAIQNMEYPADVFSNAATHMTPGGKLVIVMNHPCFRIPRQTSWNIDDRKKLQSRQIDSYMSSQKIPILAHPSKGEKSEKTISFHHPLSKYFQWLNEAGFAVDKMEEWCSNKVSTGSKAKMENRARDEFPLFLALRAVKK
ncbi:MAG: class I SAM-dependent methyltransferase [Chlamydiota bacterium]|nr:class I SAM-dependent methyltransferase [Chlamydiota bacterium]